MGIYATSSDVMTGIKFNQLRLIYVLILLTGLLTTKGSAGRPLELYMREYCESTSNIRVDKSTILHFDRPTRLPAERPANSRPIHCGLTISAKDRSNRLLMHIINLHIDLQYTDRLHVYEMMSEQRLERLSPSDGLYGKYGGVIQMSGPGISDYMTERDTFYLDYEGFPTQEFSGFTILFTEFHDVPSWVGSCLGMFFKCTKANICIHSALTCDANRNCGEFDNSDEAACNKALSPDEAANGDNTMPIALSVGIVATLTFLLVSLAIFLVTRLRRSSQAGNHRRQPRCYTVPGQDDMTSSQVSLERQIYAPPSYDDVMLSRPDLVTEDPPPYDSLVSVRVEEITRGHRRRGGQDNSTSGTESSADAASTSEASSTASVSDAALICAPYDADKDDDIIDDIPMVTILNSNNLNNNNVHDDSVTEDPERTVKTTSEDES